jgi:hypothetical protein
MMVGNIGIVVSIVGLDMKSNKILYSKGKNDECFTPQYAVIPILKYIPKDLVIWLPFDKKESFFYKEISKTNPVIETHIDNGQDG